MAKFTNPLDNVRVATPCPADWDGMSGNEKVRFCNQCQLNVYNLSGMTRREAEELITNTEGRLCIRFYRRTDGSVITKNCPVGLQALKRRVSRAATAFLSAVVGFFGGLGLFAAFSGNESSDNHPLMGAIAIEEPTRGKATMGDMAPEVVQGKPEVEVKGEMVAKKPYSPNKRSNKRVYR
jgi:hypothetical protein